MKITFKDTLIKENALTYVMVLCGIAGAVTALFIPSWTGFFWALAAATVSYTLVHVNTENKQLKEKNQELSDKLDTTQRIKETGLHETEIERPQTTVPRTGSTSIEDRPLTSDERKRNYNSDDIIRIRKEMITAGLIDDIDNKD